MKDKPLAAATITWWEGFIYSDSRYSDTTARSAFNRGYETWLVSDACGTANDAQHQAGLKGFGFAFGEVLTTEEVIGRLKKDGVL